MNPVAAHEVTGEKLPPLRMVRPQSTISMNRGPMFLNQKNDQQNKRQHGIP
jgi:hypothetical protein